MSSRRPNDVWRSLRFRLTASGILLLGITTMAVLVTIRPIARAVLLTELEAGIRSEVVEWAAIYRLSGADGLRIDFDAEMSAHGSRGAYCRMIDASGKVVLETSSRGWERLPLPPRDLEACAAPRVDTVSLPGARYPARVAHYLDDVGRRYQLARSERAAEEVATGFGRIALGGAIAVVTLGAIGMFWIGRRTAVELEGVTEHARRLAAGDFSSALEPTGSTSEVEALAHAFGRMQSKIEDLIGGLRDVSINVAHDLRGPLTRIRAAAELAITQSDSTEEKDDALGIVIEECDRLVAVVGTMLDIAEAESGLVDYRREWVDLSELLHQAADLFATVADERDVELVIASTDEGATVRGDRSKLQRVIANLVENAIKFTPPGGTVTLSGRVDDDEAVVDIRDNGVGIPESEVSRVFDRFFRGERSRTTPGNGLGLSLVASIVRAHGGHVGVRSVPRRQTVFTIALPFVPRPAESALRES